MKLGSHLSVAGGLHLALIEAQRLGMGCVQVFTKNQRQWRVPPLTDEHIKLWHEHVNKTGIKSTVSHNSYLINLASPVADTRRKSIALQRHELLRCEALGIQHLVLHPGAHMQAGEDAGLRRVAKSLDRLHKDLPGLKVQSCLEITAGQGTSLGWCFEHLQRIIELVSAPQRLAVCLDTAHMLAAGYDLTSERGARTTLTQCDRILGPGRVAVLHLNDSKKPRGSRVDRHEHIGHGHVSLDAFRVFVRRRAFAKVPMILETAKQFNEQGVDWDTVNMDTLRSLARPKRAKPK
jgi:deoxyribonuclease-4